MHRYGGHKQPPGYGDMLSPPKTHGGKERVEDHNKITDKGADFPEGDTYKKMGARAMGSTLERRYTRKSKYS